MMKSKKDTKLIECSHIGDGLYMTDNGYDVSISVNHYLNNVAYIDILYLDNAIEYLQEVKKRIEQ